MKTITIYKNGIRIELENYIADEQGNIYSKGRKNKWSFNKYDTPKLLKPQLIGGNKKNNKKYHAVRIEETFYYVHRIMGWTYLNSDLKSVEINHKNCIKTDNRLENLEVVTRKENLIHARENGCFNCLTRKKYQKPNYKTTYQVIEKDCNGNVLNIYDDVEDAAQKLKINKRTLQGKIGKCKYDNLYLICNIKKIWTIKDGWNKIVYESENACDVEKWLNNKTNIRIINKSYKFDFISKRYYLNRYEYGEKTIKIIK